MASHTIFSSAPLTRASLDEVAPSAWGVPSVEVISDPATFAGMESAWNETVERAGVEHPFLRHEWLCTWWDCFGAGRRLHIVVVRSNGRIMAIAPLMWDTKLRYGVPVRCLRLLQNDHTPRTDIIVAERPEDSYRAIWRSLMNSPETWDVLQLSQVLRSSPTLSTLLSLAEAEGCKSGVWHSDDSPYLLLDRPWDTYCASLKPKLKQNLRNRWSRLEAIGSPILQVLQDRSAVQAASDEALHLEASGWKYHAGTAIGSDSWAHHFYTRLATRAAGRGWLRLLFLTVNGRRIATAYSACYQDRLMFLKTGYDPEYAKYSPFNLLTHAALRDAFAADLAEVDFLGDNEPWKLEWTKTTRPHDWLFIFRPTLRGQLVHQLKFRLKPAFQRWREA
jgi:CelD/BcsL family acetyltransferase involved in cellulose biosynthesis